MTPETIADLRAARVPLAAHMPVLLLGTDHAGQPFTRRALVLGWTSRPGAWLVDYGDIGPARVRYHEGRWELAGLDLSGRRRRRPDGPPLPDRWIFEPWHCEPVVNLDERVGFLLAVDEAERRGARLDYHVARSLDWWERHRDRMVVDLAHALRAKLPLRYTVVPDADRWRVKDRDTGEWATDGALSSWGNQAGAEALAARLNVGGAR